MHGWFLEWIIGAIYDDAKLILHEFGSGPSLLRKSLRVRSIREGLLLVDKCSTDVTIIVMAGTCVEKG